MFLNCNFLCIRQHIHSLQHIWDNMKSVDNIGRAEISVVITWSNKNSTQCPVNFPQMCFQHRYVNTLIYRLSITNSLWIFLTQPFSLWSRGDYKHLYIKIFKYVFFSQNGSTVCGIHKCQRGREAQRLPPLKVPLPPLTAKSVNSDAGRMLFVRMVSWMMQVPMQTAVRTFPFVRRNKA